MQAREATLAELRKYTESYVPTLRSDDLVAARAAKRADDALVASTGAAASAEGAAPPAALPPADAAEVEAMLAAAGAPAAPTAEGEAAELVTGEEAIQFALELEGYCPVTIAQRDGLVRRRPEKPRPHPPPPPPLWKLCPFGLPLTCPPDAI